MRLDINHQPLNFDIYLSQVIDLPKTSLDEAPYDFQLEQEALRMVDNILERTTSNLENAISDEHRNLQNLLDKNPMLIPTTVNQNYEQQCNSQTTNNSSSPTSTQPLHLSVSRNQIGTSTATTTIDTTTPSSSIAPVFLPPPSCPIETPLTPIKCFIESTSNSTAATNSNKSNQETSSSEHTVNQINPKDFEEMHYNPFDHLELQTIDELRELDLVFQASYANQASKQ